jgi:hypothetical protein
MAGEADASLQNIGVRGRSGRTSEPSQKVKATDARYVRHLLQRELLLGFAINELDDSGDAGKSGEANGPLATMMAKRVSQCPHKNLLNVQGIRLRISHSSEQPAETDELNGIAHSWLERDATMPSFVNKGFANYSGIEKQHLPAARLSGWRASVVHLSWVDHNHVTANSIDPPDAAPGVMDAGGDGTDTKLIV